MAYIDRMIQSFRSKALQRFADKGDASKLSVQNVDRVRRMLAFLDGARRPEEINIVGYHFHQLAGDQAGRYSVRVTGNWRVTFGWNGDDAVDVDLEDYH